MAKYLGTAFRALRERTLAEYDNPEWPAGRKWLRRVGVPRLMNEMAAGEASSLLHDASLSVHRNEPELRTLLVAAREAVNEYHVAALRENWKRFER